MKKNQEGSDVTKVNGNSEDDVMQDEDWFRLGATTDCINVHTCMSVDYERAICGVKWKLHAGGTNCGCDNDEAESEPVPRFTEAFCAFEKMKAVTYDYNITIRDQANVFSIER